MFVLPLSLAALSALIVNEVVAIDVSSTASAVQWIKMTNPCKAALSGIVDGKSDFSKCSGAGKLFSNLVSNSAVADNKLLIQDGTSDLIPHIQTWLEEDLCKKDTCSPQVTNSIAQNLTESCTVDIKNGNIIALTAQGALLNYGAARRTFCLYDSAAAGNSTSYCPTEMLNNVKSSGVPISYESMTTLLKDPMNNLQGLKPWTYCNSCGKGSTSGLVSVLDNLDGSWGTAVSKIMDGQCGTGFADGSTPESLGDGTKTTTKGAVIPGSTQDGSTSASPSGDGTQTPDGESSAYRLHGSVTIAGGLLLVVASVVTLGL